MFIETRLLDKVAYGFEGGPSFVTTKVNLFSGVVARNAERSTPLYLYNAPFNAINDGDHDIVIASFNACLGGLHSFRFKDWADFELDGETLGTAVGGAGETMQLIKTYSFGATDTVRTIKKPVTGTVQLYEDGTPLASSVDTTTGIVTFTSTVGKVITADAEFDVPVMFEEDKMPFSYFNWRLHSLDINLKEDLLA
jgi:uncharacterized protein (TIGR02217 family)